MRGGVKYANFDASDHQHRLSTWRGKVAQYAQKDDRTQSFDEFLLLQLFYPK